MPLTEKGSKILRAMSKQHGAKKGKSVFYASINKGNISGAEKSKSRGKGNPTMKRFHAKS